MDPNLLDQAEFADNPEPRCPVVLLLDTSGSMQGAPVQELNGGLRAFSDALKSDRLASLRVEVAVVAFGGKVRALDVRGEPRQGQRDDRLQPAAPWRRAHDQRDTLRRPPGIRNCRPVPTAVPAGQRRNPHGRSHPTFAGPAARAQGDLQAERPGLLPAVDVRNHRREAHRSQLGGGC